MKIEEITQAAMAKANATPEAEEAPKLPLSDFISKMSTENPGGIVDSSLYGATEKVPGFEEMTLGLCEIYGITYSFLNALIDIKSSDTVFRPHVVRTSEGFFIVRAFTRMEWANLQKKLIEEAINRVQKHKEAGSNDKWIETDLNFCNEEAIVITGTVLPKLDKSGVRGLPSGVVSQIFEAIMAATGHTDQQLPPMPVK